MKHLALFIRRTGNWWIKFVIGPIFERLGLRAPATTGDFGSFIAQSDAINENNACATVLVAGGLFFSVEVAIALCRGRVGIVGSRAGGYAIRAADFYRKNEPFAFWALVGVYGAIGLFSLIAGVELFRGHLLFGG